MWRLVCVAFVTISLVVGFGAIAYAQALAPSALNLASHDQKSADDMVQMITEQSARETKGKPVQAITKKRPPVVPKKPAQPIGKGPAPALAKGHQRTFP